MILVTTGTHFQPFDRLVRAADNFASTTSEEVIIQTGCSKFQCENAKHFATCSKEEMKDYQDRADIIVMQGGWGGLCECIDKKKVVIAVPRIEGVEHIHDQEQVVRKLEDLGCIIGVYDIDDLPNAIEKARNFKPKSLERGDGAEVIRLKLISWFG